MSSSRRERMSLRKCPPQFDWMCDFILHNAGKGVWIGTEMRIGGMRFTVNEEIIGDWFVVGELKENVGRLVEYLKNMKTMILGIEQAPTGLPELEPEPEPEQKQDHVNHQG